MESEGPGSAVNIDLGGVRSRAQSSNAGREEE